MTKGIIPENNLRKLHIWLAFTLLLLYTSISSASYGNSGNVLGVCPCTDIYTGNPGNCSSIEPMAAAVYQTGPSIAYNTNKSLSVFIRDGNANLEYVPQIAASAMWQNLYGGLNGDPVAITRKGGVQEVFYVGLDEAVWYIMQQKGGISGWSKHTLIGGAAGGQVTVAYDAATDKVQLYYKGDDQSLMTIVENGSMWGKPTAILPAGSLTSNISYLDMSGRRYLFYRAMDNSLSIMAVTPGSTAAGASMTLTKPWSVTSNIAPALDASGNIIAFYRGADYAIWKVASAGGAWVQPLSLGGRASSDLYVTPLPGKQLRVYYRAPDGGVYFVQQDPSATNGWGRHRHLLGVSASAGDTSGATLLSQTLYSNPVVGINPNGQQEVFYVGSEGAIWYMSETASASSAQPYPAWSAQAALDKEVGLAPRGNSIMAVAVTGSQPIANYTTLDGATLYDIIGTVPFSAWCVAGSNPLVIGFNHPMSGCNGFPVTRATGIALLIDDIQQAISAVKGANAGSATQVQFDALVKAQLKKMGIL